MKIIITTQHRENYGESDNPYWKNKGGDIYVIPNQADPSVEIGIRDLIETRNSMFEEFVIGCNVVEDDAVVCEPWEAPYELFWEQGRWVARRTVKNDQHSYMRREIAAKTEEYDMLSGGERGNYRAMYTMVNGDTVDSERISEYLSKVES